MRETNLYEYHEGSGKYYVELKLFTTAEGYILHLLGGDKPHVGAVVISQPRESLTGDGRTSCTTSSLPFLGHMDDVAAKPIAEAVAKATGQRVVAISGVHIDKASANEIEIVQSNVKSLMERLLQDLL